MCDTENSESTATVAETVEKLCKAILGERYYEAHSIISTAAGRDIISPMNTEGTTPLYCCAYKNHPALLYELVHSLKSNRVLNTVVQPSGGTALHAAAFFGHAACVAILLFYGINDQIVNNKGHTAKEEAKGSEVSEIFTLFSRKGKRGLQKKFPQYFGTNPDNMNIHIHQNILDFKDQVLKPSGSSSLIPQIATIKRKKQRSSSRIDDIQPQRGENIELALIYHKAQELEKKLYQPETTVTLDADTNSLLNLILRSNFLAKKKEKHISELNDLLQGDGDVFLVVRDNNKSDVSEENAIKSSGGMLSPMRSPSQRRRHKAISLSASDLLSATSRSMGSDSGDRKSGGLGRGSDDSGSPCNSGRALDSGGGVGPSFGSTSDSCILPQDSLDQFSFLFGETANASPQPIGWKEAIACILDNDVKQTLISDYEDFAVSRKAKKAPEFTHEETALISKYTSTAEYNSTTVLALSHILDRPYDKITSYVSAQADIENKFGFRRKGRAGTDSEEQQSEYEKKLKTTVNPNHAKPGKKDLFTPLKSGSKEKPTRSVDASSCEAQAPAPNSSRNADETTTSTTTKSTHDPDTASIASIGAIPIQESSLNAV